MTYQISLTRCARRDLAEGLPESVATACFNFMAGPLAENPRRVGKPLVGPMEGLHTARRGEFRVIYRIDDDQVVVLVITVQHRRDVYRRS